MNIFIVIGAAILVLIFFMQFKTRSASMKLAGRPAPEGIPQTSQGVIYYFHHPRCGPCRPMGRVMDEVATRHPEQVVKVNVAEDMALAQSFGILATPTTLLIKDGLIAKVILGTQSVRQVEALLE